MALPTEPITPASIRAAGRGLGDAALGDAPGADRGEPATVSDDDEVREHASPLVRVLLLVAGTLCVVLGLIGIVLPLLPTTPFLILAAACYARASRRFYERLLASPSFGPLIREWRRHRSVPYRAKVSAIVLMSVTLTISIVYFVPIRWVQVLLAILGISMAIWMYRLPSRDRPRDPSRRRPPT